MRHWISVQGMAAGVCRVLRAGLIAVAAIVAAGHAGIPAFAAGLETTPITQRHTDIPNERPSGMPRSEHEQVVVRGWPMYRTERGQEAFNHAMATFRATDGASPSAEAFRGCENLHCRLTLPRLTSHGWIPAGRLWISPDEYVLIVHSPRRSKLNPGRRRSRLSMRYFIFHEFQNSSGNTDLYDTISAHRSSVFVSFYLGKPGRDAQGRRYVVVVQTAPHDIVSRHASNYGSAGPGIEVAKNRGERLPHLQAAAGILVATIVKNAEPQLRVIHHRNTEGLPMLRAYRQRLAAMKSSNRSVRLPFVAASGTEIASATGSLSDIIVHNGRPWRRPSADPELRPSMAAAVPRLVAAPRLVRAIQAPALTMETLLRRVLGTTPVAPPEPQPVCRTAPGFVCR